MKPDYKKMVKDIENKLGRKFKKIQLGYAYFYTRNKKIFDDLYKIVIKSIKVSFKNEKNSRLKEKKTVKKFKDDIKKEKNLVKEIQKKHPFVKKILASRV